MFDRLFQRSSNKSADNEAFIRLVYKTLLKRLPDDEGLRTYLGRLNVSEMSHAHFISSLLESDEYKILSGKLGYLRDPEIAQYLTDEVQQDSATLGGNLALDDATYQNAWASIFDSGKPLIIGQQEYGRQHKRRFRELFNAVTLLTGQNLKPKILEFGISEFSALHHLLNPNTILHTADRPTPADYAGFTKTVCERISGCEFHAEIDLNQPHEIGEKLTPHSGTYDLVVLAEILEHLVVNPVELLRQLLRLLKPSGSLYLTTPNFYRRENLERIDARRNPQHLFPGQSANWDAHFHHREYCLKELLDLIRQAGGETAMFYFSDCWDDDPKGTMPLDQRGNLVFVIRNAASNSQPKP